MQSCSRRSNRALKIGRIPGGVLSRVVYVRQQLPSVPSALAAGWSDRRGPKDTCKLSAFSSTVSGRSLTSNVKIWAEAHLLVSSQFCRAWGSVLGSTIEDYVSQLIFLIFCQGLSLFFLRECFLSAGAHCVRSVVLASSAHPASVAVLVAGGNEMCLLSVERAALLLLFVAYIV